VLDHELVAFTRDGDTDAADVMRKSLVDASTRTVDKKFLDPTFAAVVGVSPASITNGATAVTATGNLAADLAALVAAFTTQRPNAVSPAFVLSPTIVTRIAAIGTHHDLTVNGGTLLGVPAVTTVGAGNTVVLLDAAGVVYNDQGADVDVSTHAAIQMDTAPTHPVVAATVVVDLWSKNMVGLRLDRFVTWARDASSAVAYLVVG
jgi:hypothetical protein